MAIALANADRHPRRDQGGVVPGTHDNPLIQPGPDGAPVGARPVPGTHDRNRFWNKNDVAPYNPPGVDDDRMQDLAFGGRAGLAMGGSLAHGDPLGGLAKPHAVNLGSTAPLKQSSPSAIAGHVNIPHPWFQRSEARQMGKGFADGGDVAANDRTAENNLRQIYREIPGNDIGGTMSWNRLNDISGDLRKELDNKGLRGFADGGGVYPDMPFNGGLIGGSGGGRTDRLPLSVPDNSHVVTADVMSGMGQGHTAFGGRLLTQALRIGPYGVPVPTEIHGHGPPHAPMGQHLAGEKSGGRAEDHGRRVGILAASGEFVIPAEDWVAKDDIDGKLYLHRGVRSIGEGDMKKGHDRIDQMMKKVRDFNIAWLRRAPPPKK